MRKEMRRHRPEQCDIPGFLKEASIKKGQRWRKEEIQMLVVSQKRVIQEGGDVFQLDLSGGVVNWGLKSPFWI